MSNCLCFFRLKVFSRGVVPLLVVLTLMASPSFAMGKRLTNYLGTRSLSSQEDLPPLSDLCPEIRRGHFAVKSLLSEFYWNVNRVLSLIGGPENERIRDEIERRVNDLTRLREQILNSVPEELRLNSVKVVDHWVIYFSTIRRILISEDRLTVPTDFSFSPTQLEVSRTTYGGSPFYGTLKTQTEEWSNAVAITAERFVSPAEACLTSLPLLLVARLQVLGTSDTPYSVPMRLLSTGE